MTKNRIPRRIRKACNRIAPGKYVDPTTGRIYVDSADMDNAFEETLDKAESDFDANQRARPAQPPDEYLEIAERNVRRFWDRAERVHRDRLQVIAQRENVASRRSRLKTLRAILEYRTSMGLTVEPYVREEIRRLEEESDGDEEEARDQEEASEGGAADTAGGDEALERGGGGAPAR